MTDAEKSMANSIRPAGARFGLPAYFSNSLTIAADSGNELKLGQLLFALTFIGLGIDGLVSGLFAEVWQPVPKWLPLQAGIAYLCALLMLACGVGLLWKSRVTLATRALFIYMLLWVVLLKLPPIVLHPLVEFEWAACGEILVMLAGAWTLFALNAGAADRAKFGFATGRDGIRIARLLLVIALIFVGLEHILYAAPTADFVPAWIPYHLFWAYFVGRRPRHPLRGHSAARSDAGIPDDDCVHGARVGARLPETPEPLPVDGFPHLQRPGVRHVGGGGFLSRITLVQHGQVKSLSCHSRQRPFRFAVMLRSRPGRTSCPARPPHAACLTAAPAGYRWVIPMRRLPGSDQVYRMKKAGMGSPPMPAW